MSQVNFRTQPDFPKLEEQILKWWQETEAFEQSVQMNPEDKRFVFYDGPPFATGMPHYGHLLASTTKDVIPRYWTMKGYRVDRIWGWDCHGLPIENMIEQQLGIEGGKMGIEKLGIDVFNNACRTEVLRLDKEWEKIIDRLGRWVDFENNYKTMDCTFMESVWWGFKQMYDKDLVYEGRRVILYCPRCGTPLSNFEIAMDNSYKDVQDLSVFVKFKRKDSKNEYFVAWTTTPWTLPGNVGLAVKPEATYVQMQVGDELLWMAEDRVEAVLTDQAGDAQLLKTTTGAELENIEYEPLYEYLPIENQKAFYIIADDFVALDEGTGIVHTAAMYGEEDYRVALERDLPTIPMLNEEGHFMDFVELVSGKFYKSADKIVATDLEERDLLLRKETITHSYPHCYRCNTPLYYNAVPAWFFNISQIRNQLIEQNEQINWHPDHLKHGRFLKGLEGAPDWNISRSRYWGTPMPIWRSEDGEQLRIIGSIAELQKWAVDATQVAEINDIHREHLDDVELWVDDDKTIKGKRIPEVFDCWVESGSMPFASVHYPFENKEKFENNYPAQFVSEYIAQTRAWFYTMHVMSVGIFGKPPFENVLTTGTILAEDGTKMSKSKHNYPDPMVLINKYGVDSLRLYLMSSTVMKGENLNFSEKEVSDIRRKVFVIWWNVVKFFQMFADQTVDVTTPPQNPADVMDQWLLSSVQSLITDVTTYMEEYDLIRASRTLMEFVDQLSTWYLRLSRDRLRDSNNTEASQVFGYAIYTLAQLFAPLTPYFSELIHHSLVNQSTSIHHSHWPTVEAKLHNPELEQKMNVIRDVVNQARAIRTEAGIKLRQPLKQINIVAPDQAPAQELLDVIAQELNVKKVNWQTGESVVITLDTALTAELEAEGEARELMRTIQKLRKQAGLSMNDHVQVELPDWPEDWQTEIELKTNTKLVKGNDLRILSS